MIVHIKNITATHEEINEWCKQWGNSTRHKDTYSIIVSTDADFEKVTDFEKALKKKGKIILIKKNGL
jgi:hypothetical protein